MVYVLHSSHIHGHFHTGECDANPYYMLTSCAKSCKTCHLDPRQVATLARYKTKLHAVGGDARLLETPYGITQVTDGLDPGRVQEIESNMNHYMERIVMKDRKYADVRNTCKNVQPNCIQLKLDGKCNSVSTKCAPVCETCLMLDFKHRCPIDESIPPALHPGDLNKIFERIVTEEHYQQYEPKVLSRPATNVITNTSLAADGSTSIPDGPWVVVLEKFLTPDECQYIQDLGHQEGYHRSADVGPKNLEGATTAHYSDGRTSTNAWCLGRCARDSRVQVVTDRIVNLTGIPQENFEYLQLLRYEPGQHYHRHHDFADYHLDRQYGPRVLTVFLYLNTVEEGGGTDFPVVNVTVEAKMGRAVIWPSILNDHPKQRDDRTDHAALPVVKGIKYGANAWIHQNDFRVPFSKNCI
jgi:prolyl 4-hydroxylase